MKPHLILTGTIAALSLAACETTGDPTQGGLFGWSESKARTRQAALQDAVHLEHGRTAEARAETGGLQAQRSRNTSAIRSERAELNRMLSQLDDVDRAGGSARTSGLRSRISQTRNDSGLDDAEMRAKVNSLDGEVRSLRSEYGLLQQRR
jgi:hypothetical protein